MVFRGRPLPIPDTLPLPGREEFRMLKIGAKAPAFRLLSDEGEPVALKDYAGQRVLLFLYPKANTSG
jgi:peroxiredoxin